MSDLVVDINYTICSTFGPSWPSIRRDPHTPSTGFLLPPCPGLREATELLTTGHPGPELLGMPVIWMGFVSGILIPDTSGLPVDVAHGYAGSLRGARMPVTQSGGLFIPTPCVNGRSVAV